MRRQATTPQHSFQPAVNKTKFWDTPNTSLLNRSASAQGKYSASNRSTSAQGKYIDPEATFKPQLSHRSLNMASRMGNSYERLTK